MIDHLTPSTATTIRRGIPMQVQRHRFAFAKQAVIPLLLGYEFAVPGLGVLIASLFSACAYFRHMPIWKVLVGYLFVLCLLPTVALAVAIALT